MAQPNEKATTSLRLEAPGLGFGLDTAETEQFMDAARRGVIVPETPCDKGMQDNFALRATTKVSLTSTT
jgi:hypothetical protein